MGGLLSALGGGFADQLLNQLKSDLVTGFRDLKKSLLFFAAGAVFVFFGAFASAASLFFALAELTRWAQAGLWTALICFSAGLAFIRTASRIAPWNTRPGGPHHRAREHPHTPSLLLRWGAAAALCFVLIGGTLHYRSQQRETEIITRLDLYENLDVLSRDDFEALAADPASR